jgi:hypothetical protein
MHHVSTPARAGIDYTIKMIRIRETISMNLANISKPHFDLSLPVPAILSFSAALIFKTIGSIATKFI